MAVHKISRVENSVCVETWSAAQTRPSPALRGTALLLLPPGRLDVVRNDVRDVDVLEDRASIFILHLGA